MRLIFMVVLVAALMMTGTLTYGEAADRAGIVKTMAGEVVIARSGRTIVAEPNLILYEDDVVQTGPNGKAGLILEDDTVISMGLNSRFAIENFKYKPYEKKLSLIVRVFQGTVSLLCGQIAKLAPDMVHIKTPNATIGVRGTHILIKVD